VLKLIKDKYGVAYQRSNVYNLRHKLGFSYQRSRGYFPEVSGRSEQVAAIKKTSEYR
jgi:transposase